MTAPDPLGVHIGAREIYDAVIGVDRKTDQIDHKVDRLVERHDEVRAIVARHDERLDDHDRALLPRNEFEAYKQQTEAKSNRRSQDIAVWAGITVSAAIGVGGLIVPLVTR